MATINATNQEASAARIIYDPANGTTGENENISFVATGLTINVEDLPDE